MGDENQGYASGGFMFKCSDDGEWQNLGYIGDSGISFAADSDDDELEMWAEKLAELSQTMTIRLRIEWWSLNRFYKKLIGRCRYTVPSLRKGKKGHLRGHER